MVQRRFLTSDFVDSDISPKSGEIWIADTEVKGFGLRVWATKGGQKRAFAIRASNFHGKSVRKSFRYAQSFYFESAQPTIGAILPAAREWAKIEIKRLKTPAAETDWKVAYSRDSKRVRSIKLGVAAERLLKIMRARGLSERYIDHLDRIFFTQIPQRLRNTSLGSTKEKQLAKAIVDSSLSHHNAIILRSFVSQIFLKASKSHGAFIGFPSSFSEEFWSQWKAARDVRYPELRDLSGNRYQSIFSFLEEHSNWQQALAIRIYFEFKSPLQSVLRAQWGQIVRGSWFPYRPDQRVHWLSYEDRVEGEKRRLLDIVNDRVSSHFGRSTYWFPAEVNRPIQTVQSVWKGALAQAGLPYYPLHEFSRSYRELNNPSYYIGFLKQFGDAIAKGKNAAELSTFLQREEISKVFSDAYR